MPRKPIEFSLDFMIKDIFSRFAIKQFDDVSFNITPMNQNKPYDTTNMRGKIFVGVNNDMFMQDTNITVSSNNINVLLDKNMLQKQGRAYAEIELTDENGTITSSSFVFDIEPKIGEGATISGEYEGFVAKYERLVSEFKGQVNNAILDSSNRTTNTIAKFNSDSNTTINMIKNNGENSISTFNSNSSNAISTFNTNSNNKLTDIEKRFQTLTISKQQDTEVIDARDNEVSLKARLDRDLAKGKIINENVEGNYITVNDSVGGSISNIEILGNTIQDTVDLKDIKSVANLQNDGLYKMSILSKKGDGNLFSSKFIIGDINVTTGEPQAGTQHLASIDFSSIMPNTSIIANRTFNLYTYDKNKKFIERISLITKTTVKNNVYYFKVVIASNTDVNTQLMINEGTTLKSYEPYQGDKTSTSLPCQLEKVGDIADRLFRREDGIWCIEKNIGEVILNGSENGWMSSSNSNGLCLFYTSKYNSVFKTSSQLISNNFINDSELTKENIFFNTFKNLCINITETKLSTKDLTGFKTWLSQNPTLVKYQLATPKTIELPLDTQIQLNSFFGTTNIFTEDTVIEPIIKATVPKSLGASIQSINKKTDNLSDRVEKVETLKKSNELEVYTDKGYVVCENTNEGYIEDLKIEGKTLVNLIDIKSKTTSGSVVVSDSKITINDGARLDFNTITLKSQNSYTLCLKVEKGTSQGIVYGFLDTDWAYTSSIKEDGYFIIKISPSRDVSKFRFHIFGNTGVSYISNIMLLEGDHTQNPPPYFEGLKSVGDNVDNIEVVSRKEDGNLIDINDNNFVLNKMINVAGNLYETSSINTSGYIFRGNNTIFTVPNGIDSSVGIAIYDKNKKFIKTKTLGKGTPRIFTVDEGVFFRVSLDSNYPFECYEGNTLRNQLYQGNKKQILFKNSTGTYEKPILRSTGAVSDTIEKHSDGKYYLHKRCGEVVLNASLNWLLNGSQPTDTSMINFYVQISNAQGKGSKLVCDKLNNVIDLNSGEGIYFAYGSSNLLITILKSKLSTQDISGFKTWLQSNQITVVYLLAIEEVYEVVNLDLDSYQGETSVIVDSGAISPSLSFKIASHIGNTISVLKDKINYLEDKIITMFKNVLAGDVQTLAYELYPEDFRSEIIEEEIETVEGTELL